MSNDTEKLKLYKKQLQLAHDTIQKYKDDINLSAKQRDRFISGQETKIAMLQDKINTIEIKVADEIEAAKLKEEAFKEMASSMDEFVKEREIYYITSAGCYTEYFKSTGEWLNYRTDALKERYPELRTGEIKVVFDIAMEKHNRKFDGITVSLNDQPAHILNRMRRDHWLKPVYGEENHWLFDVLMHSLGGGKPENIEHIGQVLAWKYIHPEEFKLPALIIYGEGGVGKNLLVDVILKCVYGPQAITLTYDMIDGNFNSMLCGKVVVFIDEQAHEKTNMDVMKRMVQNKTLAINEKYGPQMIVDNSALYITGDNGCLSGIKLAHDESDRRWSIIRIEPGHTFAYWVSQSLECSIDDAKKFIKDNEYIFKDKDEVARWLGNMIDTYGNIASYPNALHGDDYNTLGEQQTDIGDDVLDDVFSSTGFDWISRDTLYAIYKYKHYQGMTTRAKGITNFTAHAVNWLKRNKPNKFIYERKNISVGGDKRNRLHGFLPFGHNGVGVIDNQQRWLDHFNIPNDFKLRQR